LNVLEVKFFVSLLLVFEKESAHEPQLVKLFKETKSEQCLRCMSMIWVVIKLKAKILVSCFF